MRTVGILTVLAVALVVSAAAGILVGAVAIGPSDVFAALFGSNDVNGTIIRELRLPRVLGAALVGGALATAGALLQGLLRNPLADPFVTGTSAGATLAAVAAIALAGLVGFVGLVIPHALRFVIGATHRRLVPASFLAGATALVLADLGARTIIAPAELPLGAITGLIGAPFFLALLVRSRRVVV